MIMQYPRWLLAPLEGRRSRGKARLVLGARQTGKSTLFRMLKGDRDMLVDLQERSERLRLGRDPEALTRALLPARRHRHVLIDEVQRVPALLDEIQLLLDRHPGRFTFTLTGSSARRLRRRDVNLLPGRIHRFSLGPVCGWELEGPRPFAVLPPPRPVGAKGFPRRRLGETLVFGCLPAAFVERSAFEKTLESYAEVYVEEEVQREAAARNIGPYGRFLELAAIDSGRPVNLTKISQESGIALSTLRQFYSVLEDTLLGFSLPPFPGSGRARVLKTPRFFFFDVGVRNALARLPLDERMLATEAGSLLEQWVACELRTRTDYLGPTYRLSYWRTVDGAEVDLVLETPREVIPIEVKYTRNPRPADARALEHFLSRYPRRARRGFLVCRTARPEQLTERVRSVPWDEL
jgi:predicted AAA+ superfamily ATPase